jgi:hypothetical protein
MTRYEYEITRHSADEFTEVIYFCAPDGKCNVEKIPLGQLEKIRGILNGRGEKGWELVQVTFGKDGIMVFWKRMIIDKHVGRGKGFVEETIDTDLEEESRA